MGLRWGQRAQRTELVFLLHEALGQSVEALPPHILHTDYLHTCVTASAHHNTIELRSSRPAPYLPLALACPLPAVARGGL